jgi:nucleoside-diphosphate-sugar epimerase
VTGNLGYVGPLVVRRLRQEHPDAELIGYDSGYFAHCLSGRRPVPESLLNVQYFGDIRALDESVLRGVNSVVHLSAISNDAMGAAYEAVTLAINHQASVELARKARKAGVGRFVFASSCSVYGFAEGGPRREGDPLNPLTAYARSKVLTEQDLEGLADESFVVSCLRFATACGMSERIRLDLVLNDFVASALASEKITILSDGTPWRPLIHVADMARAIDWAVQREPAQGGPFLIANVGTDGWNYQVKELAEAVAAAVPGVVVSIDPAARPDGRSYRVDFGKFTGLAAGFLPEMTLDAAVRDLLDGLNRIGFRDSDFRSGPYMRLVTLRRLREAGELNDQLQWSARRSG